MIHDSTVLPQLAPPGAGLPKPELFVANLLFHFRRWRSSRAKAVAEFATLRDELLLLGELSDAFSGTRRVLIARLPGLEDSSRYWSVFMTFDHLRIVNDFISETIAALLAGRSPERVADTAAVKPTPLVEVPLLLAFAESCRRLEQTVADVPNLTTPLRHPHPWFGLLDAGSWHFLAGFHMRLHLQQILKIREALSVGVKS